MTNRIEETPTEARQGDGRRMNLRVLLASTLGIVFVFAAIYLVYFALAPAGV
jgi:hypothetical protein